MVWTEPEDQAPDVRRSPQAAAMRVACPRPECGAPQGEPCRNPASGVRARIPCVARLLAGVDADVLSSVV